MRTSFKNAVTGRLDMPIRLLIYSEGGRGKSTLASEAPSPIFLDVEHGTHELNVIRYPDPTEDGEVVPWTWADISSALDELYVERHEFKTVVIDSIDKLESIIWQSLCASNKWKSIESPGYGKGFTSALEIFRTFANKLEKLWQFRGMNVILIGHSTVKGFANPEGDSWDKYQIKLNEKAAGMLRDWSDVVGFLRLETYIAEKGDRKIGVISGKHVLDLEAGAAFEAKNRYTLPKRIHIEPPPHAWESFWNEVEARRPSTLRRKISELSKKLSKESQSNVTKLLSAAGDNAKELFDLLTAVEVRLTEDAEKERKT